MMLRVIVYAVTAVMMVCGLASTANAQGAARLYLTPPEKRLNQGQNLDVQVRLNTYSEKVNAVQVELSYPTDKLKFLGISNANSAFGVDAPSKGGDGVVRVSRGSFTPISGDVLVATVSFQAITEGTSASVEFLKGSTVLSSQNSSNVLASIKRGLYVFAPSPNAPKTLPENNEGAPEEDLEEKGDKPGVTGAPTNSREEIKAMMLRPITSTKADPFQVGALAFLSICLVGLCTMWYLKRRKSKSFSVGQGGGTGLNNLS